MIVAVNSLLDPQKLARLAHLRYVNDSDPGYSRERNGHGFKYLSSRGARLRSESHLARIERLAIPPAWKDVWICRFANGHLQATGLDSRQRKQYLYHEQWRSVADSAKFVRLEEFGRLLPLLRRTIARDLRGRELSRTRVLAGMVAVLDATSIRIGNEEYVRANNSYGLTTLRNRHVVRKNSHVELRFRAKGGVHREAIIEDRRLVQLMRQLKELRGGHAFQYLDVDDTIHAADAAQVNDYLRETTGKPITAKDFRTWKASALAAALLYDERDVEPVAARKKVIRKVIAAVAETLGNTPAVCRKSYIHPGLLAAYEGGDYPRIFQRFARRRKTRTSREEQIFACFLRRWKPSKRAG